MSIGSFGLAGSVAATGLAQTQGTQADRAAQTGNQQRQVTAVEKATEAAGIGQTDGQDHEAAERDADGRRLWERTERNQQSTETPPAPPTDPPLSKDATGQCGGGLDLVG